MKESAQERSLEVVGSDSSAPPSRGTHTPTPWRVESAGLGEGGPFDRVTIETVQSGGGTVIAEMNSMLPWEANATFIVKAVNNHDALVKALRDLERAAQAHLDTTDGSEREYLREECFNARAALSRS